MDHQKTSQCMHVYLRRVALGGLLFCVAALLFHAYKHLSSLYARELSLGEKARFYWSTICNDGKHMVHDGFVDCDSVRERMNSSPFWSAVDLTFQHVLEDLNPLAIEWCRSGSKCDFFVSWLVTTLVSNLMVFFLLLGVIAILVVWAFIRYVNLRSQNVELLRDMHAHNSFSQGAYQPLLQSPTPHAYGYGHHQPQPHRRLTSSMHSSMATNHSLPVITELSEDDDDATTPPLLAAFSTFANVRSRLSPHHGASTLDNT